MKKPLFIISLLAVLFLASGVAANQNIRLKPSDGVFKEYYDNGKVKFETVYKNHLRHGVTKTYYENGRLQSEYTYRLGSKDGPAKTYFETGKLKSVSHFKGDTPEGVQKLFYDNGRIKLEKKIAAGKIVYQREFESSGKLVE